MKRKKKLLSGLLAGSLMLSMMPAALAAQVTCDICHTPNSCTVTVIKEATCQEQGYEEYVCNNPDCQQYHVSRLVKTGIDKNNHEATYTDNGDGTHSGICRYDNVEIKREKHDFSSNGYCTKCRAVDYSQVKITLPETPVVYAALDDTNAVLSLDNVVMSAGTADITKEYDLSYNWYYQGKLVSSETKYSIPSTITSKEGSYQYVCFVMAVPKNSLTTQPISGSCTVTVQVRDLITAYATVGRSERSFDLGETDSYSSRSVEEQIYDAVYSRTDYRPDYVVFGSDNGSKAGTLKIYSKEKYYFDPSSKQQLALEDVTFTPSGDTTGTYTINFTAYDTKGKDFPGMLTVTVGQSTGDMDVFYTTSRDSALKLKASDFEDFWLDTYSRGLFTWVSFTQLPSSSEGSLYIDYVSATQPGTRVRTGDTFYIEPGRSQIGINDVTFIAGSRQSGYVIIPFEAYGENNSGRATHLDGNLYILVSNGAVADVSCCVAAGSTYGFNDADFLSVYRTATGNTGSSFSIQLTSVPSSGALYVNYSNGRGTKLTSSSISGRTFYYSSSRGDLIRDITYVPGSSASDKISYLAYDSQGTLLYAGNISFTVAGELVVNYNASSTGVNFKASDFENLLGTTGKLSTVSFTPPAAGYGTLYYGRSATSVGTAITSDSVWYSVSTANTGANVLSMNNVTFVPKTGYSGTVTIPFAAYDAGGSKVSGNVRVTVTAPTTPTTPVNPTTPTSPTTPANPTTPTTPNYTVKFADVPNTSSTSWYYTAVMDLAQAGVIAGRDDGKFYPDDAVTYGEALKMIMLATGYTEQAPTSKHWASGYMSRAVTDKLLSASVDPDRRITRYTIAEVAAKALKLNLTTPTTSPFTDMAATLDYAPYVTALYQAGIVNGTAEGTQVNFKGTYAIRRSEMSVIIWRINNYNRTGNANGTTGGDVG